LWPKIVEMRVGEDGPVDRAIPEEFLQKAHLVSVVRGSDEFDSITLSLGPFRETPSPWPWQWRAS
jgi:hypothetical protein